MLPPLSLNICSKIKIKKNLIRYSFFSVCVHTLHTHSPSSRLAVGAGEERTRLTHHRLQRETGQVSR